jgi:hypothetical protein
VTPEVSPVTGAVPGLAALTEVVAESLYNLDAARYWADDGEGGEHFIDYPIAALSEHLAADLLTALPEALTQTAAPGAVES